MSSKENEEAITTPVPEQFLRLSSLSLESALNQSIFGGEDFNQTGPLFPGLSQECPICGTRNPVRVESCKACGYTFEGIERSEAQSQLFLFQDGTDLHFDSSDSDMRTFFWLELLANFLFNSRKVRDHPLGIGLSDELKANLHVLLEDRFLNFFLSDFTHSAYDETIPLLTPRRFSELFSHALTAADGNCFVNFTLFWCLWKHKVPSTKKGSISPRRFLSDWVEGHPDAKTLFDPRSKQVYVCMDGTNPRLFMPPHHWIPVRTRKRVNFRVERDHSKQLRLWTLYKKYITGLTSSLSFVRCASKTTRLEKLYSKPLQFSFRPTIDSAFLEEIKAQRNLTKYDDADSQNRSVFRMMARLSRLVNQSEQNKNLKIYLDGYLKEGFGKKVFDFDKFYELLQPKTLAQDTFIHHHLHGNEPFRPLLVSGDAGKGKTVSITQFAFKYLRQIETLVENSSLEQMNTIHLPMFLRAKRIPSGRAYLNDGGFSHIPRLWRSIIGTLPNMIHHIDENEFYELLSLWDGFQHEHDSSLLIFLDGLDECDTPATAADALALFCGGIPHKDAPPMLSNGGDFQTKKEPTLILSSRPSMLDPFSDQIERFAIADMSIDNYYTDEELSLQMPLRLCDAWGITQESGLKLNQVFERHRKTLIHPLFVGWFCFLIYNDRLPELEHKVQSLTGNSSADEEQILQNNLIAFIIDVGIASSLESRESRTMESVLHVSEQKFTEILRAFVALSHHYKLLDPERVIKKLQLLGLVEELPEDVWQSILHDCGILYLTGQQIEWTHETVPEVLYADFFHEHGKKLLLGPLRVSEPVLHRLGQIYFDSGRFASFDIAMMMLYFEYNRKQFTEFAYNVWGGSANSSNGVPLITLQGLTSIVPITDNRSEIQIELANLYIGSLNTPRRFALHHELLDPKVRGQLVRLIMQSTTHHMGEDLITSHSSDLAVPIDAWRVDLIPPSGGGFSLLNCFALYRMALLDESEFNDAASFLEHPLFGYHTKMGDPLAYLNIFDLWMAGGVASFNLPVPPLYSWFAEHHRTDTIPMSEDQCRWLNKWDDVIEYISREYVFTAYDRLFGDDLSEECIDFIWDLVSDKEVKVMDETIPLQTESRNLLDFCMKELGFVDDFMLEHFESNEIVVRGVLLMPFVHLILRYHAKAHHSTPMPSGGGFIQSPFMKLERFELDPEIAKAMDLIIRFSPNLTPY